MKNDNTALIPFAYNDKTIRIIMDEFGLPWWVVKDVCNVLGYANSRDAVATHCKYAKLFKGSETLRLESPRGLTIINESDLYRLILKSNMPNAELFQDWVVEEVLPSIRKTGGYVKNTDPFDMLLSVVALIRNTQEALKEEIKDARKEIKEVKEEMNSRFLKLEQKKTLVVSNTPKVIPIKLTVRQKCRQYIEEYNRKYGIEHSELWNRAYAEMRFRYGKNFTLRAKRSGVNTIEMIEKLGLINELYSVIREIFNDKTILPEKPVRQILVKKQDVG